MEGKVMGRKWTVVLVVVLVARQLCLSKADPQMLQMQQLKVCRKDQIKHLWDRTNSMADMQWCADKVRQGGWDNGRLMRLSTTKAKFKNLGCGFGLNTSCDERGGDQFVLDWRRHRVATGCYPTHEINDWSSVQCFEHDGTRKKICSLHNARLDFRTLSVSQDKLPRRMVGKGFIFLNCKDGDSFVESTAMDGFVTQRTDNITAPVCDMIIEDEDVYLLSADNVDNIGHTLSDYLNMWMAILVSNRARGAKRRISVIIVDQMYKFKGHFRQDISSLGFYKHLELSYNRVLRATELRNKVVCVKNEVIMFSSGKEFYPFIFEGAPFNLECSYKGPSSLYQRWNIHTRMQFGTLGLSPPTDRWNVLILVRNGTAETHRDSGRRMGSKSRIEIVHELIKVPGVSVRVVDLGAHSLEEQIRMMAETNIVIGMHGAAIAMSLHMSIGTPNCCGVIEIFNPSSNVGAYLFHGNTLRSMGILYRRIPSNEGRNRRFLQSLDGGMKQFKSSVENDDEDARRLSNYEYKNAGYEVQTEMVFKIFKEIMLQLTVGQSSIRNREGKFNFNGPSCILPSIVTDPYLEG